SGDITTDAKPLKDYEGAMNDAEGALTDAQRKIKDYKKQADDYRAKGGTDEAGLAAQAKIILDELAGKYRQAKAELTPMKRLTGVDTGSGGGPGGDPNGSPNGAPSGGPNGAPNGGPTGADPTNVSPAGAPPKSSTTPPPTVPGDKNLVFNPKDGSPPDKKHI